MKKILSYIHRKENTTSRLPDFHRLEAIVDKQQHKWADYLNGKTENFNKRSKLIWLFFFCLLFGGSSTLIIVRAVSNKTASLTIKKISFPIHAVGGEKTDPFIPLPLLTTKEFENIQQFKKTMDSLQVSITGKIKYDSILKARPLLMDSIGMVEQIYKQQLKSK